MSKYEPLQRHLLACRGQDLVLSFSDIEEIVGFRLPASARKYAAWWSNSDSSHVQAQAWLDAGYETTDVDIPGERLTLSFTGTAKGFHEMQQPTLLSDAPPTKSTSRKRHPAWGALKGMITIPPDVDLTAPTYDDWKTLYGED